MAPVTEFFVAEIHGLGHPAYGRREGLEPFKVLRPAQETIQ